jgi:hypothetical protein
MIETMEISVLDLGFTQGASDSSVLEASTVHGLALCPLELGPHLRLQPEGFLDRPPSKHCAPPNSITIASEPLTEDDDFPKGFYVRRIEGTLWLRGYCSSPEHIRGPEGPSCLLLRPLTVPRSIIHPRERMLNCESADGR